MMRKAAHTGFIQVALLFGIALMTAVLGGFTLANRNASSQTEGEQAKANSSAIIKQASDFRESVSRYSSDFAASALTTDITIPDTGLFDPTSHFPESEMMSTPIEGLVPRHWHLNHNTPGNGLATAAADPMVILPSVAPDVCSRVNSLLHGVATIPESTAAYADWIGNGNGGISGVLAAAGWAEGCVQTSDARHIYFKTIQEN